jgi:hypothetical protein
MPSVNFAQLEKIICTKSVDAAIKWLMEEMAWSRNSATEFVQDYMRTGK